MTPGEPEPSEILTPGGSRSERDRLIAAFGRAASEYGYRNLTFAQVARYAETPSDRIETVFGSKEGALLAAQDAFFDRLWLDASGACRSVDDWAEGVRAGLNSVISLLAEASSLARVFAVEAPAASFVAAGRQVDALEQFASLLREGRRGGQVAAALPALTERFLIGGVASLLFAQLLAEDVVALRALEPELAALLAGPYLNPGGTDSHSGA